MMIYDLLEQIENGVGSKLYHMALFTALTVPDIGGAVDSENGEATGKSMLLGSIVMLHPNIMLGASNI